MGERNIERLRPAIGLLLAERRHDSPKRNVRETARNGFALARPKNTRNDLRKVAKRATAGLRGRAHFESKFTAHLPLGVLSSFPPSFGASILRVCPRHANEFPD